MRDLDVRIALRQKVLAGHLRDSGTLVVDELGIAHGAARVDIAVVNGWLHGFEIKSDADTLQRLPSQIEAYNSVLDRVTIVVGTKHASEVNDIVPNWWGVKVASVGPRGAVHFEDIRRPGMNECIDAFSLAGLLWRDEAIAILARYGADRVRSKNRMQLCQILATELPLDSLRAEVREALKVREDWRSDAQRVPYAGL